MSKVCKKSRDRGVRSLGDHQKYISRITKTLYYGKLPKTENFSLPVTELAAEFFSEAQRGRSIERLHVDDAAYISRNACVSPCSLVLALLYLERLKQLNPEYLEKTNPSDLFLVSLMISCKFLYDDGESNEVFIDEWATSGRIPIKQLIQLERDFLNAIKWKVYVNESTFWRKLTDLERTLAQRQGTSRGFFTYTELENLLAIIELQNIVQCLLAATIILAASYTAAILTVAGSVFVVSHIPGTCIHPKDNQTLIPITVQENFPVSTTQSCENLYVKNASDCNKDIQEITWDWWTVPIMTWLAQTSGLLQDFQLPCNGIFGNFLENYGSNTKPLELEDHIRKATKTRIQDLLESSWHKEWTETINFRDNSKHLYYYLQNIKS